MDPADHAGDGKAPSAAAVSSDAGDGSGLDPMRLEVLQVGLAIAATVAHETGGADGDERAGGPDPRDEDDDAPDDREPIALLPLVDTLPLAWLCARARLPETAALCLRVLVAGELDRKAHRLLRRLASDPTRPGVEVQAVMAVVERAGGSALEALAACDGVGPLVGAGLASLLGDGPLLTRRLTVSPRVLAHARGQLAPPGAFGPSGAFAAFLSIDEPPLSLEPARPRADLLVDDGVLARIEKLLPRVLLGEPLWLFGPPGAGKRTVLASVARALGLRLLTLPYRSLGKRRLADAIPALRREAILCEAILCVHDAQPETGDAPRALAELCEALSRARLPVVYTSEEPPPSSELSEPPHLLELPRAGLALRRRAWRALLPELADDAALDGLASRFRLTPGRIAHAAATARSLAELSESPTSLALAERAVSLQISQKVSVLGTRVEDRQGWDDVVLPPETLDAVSEIVSRARHRHRVLEEWGFHRKLAKGVGLAALFAGPPGTGKTMVAGLIARELGLELYQIDLSRIVSKYIGETEKNLSQVFDAAEGANVLLLFDEADSLFAKRTEVKSSIDRYSNLEVNYLLQRLERFEGVSVLTTNLEGSIDPAFKRRLAFRVHFPMPDEDERALLWQRMVPAEAETEGPLDFTDLARKYEFTGGNIRNAMLRAAFLAAADERGISMEHIERAVVLEYRDTGKLVATGRLT